jgi:hypothetical protein
MQRVINNTYIQQHIKHLSFMLTQSLTVLLISFFFSIQHKNIEPLHITSFFFSGRERCHRLPPLQRCPLQRYPLQLFRRL